MTEMWIWDLFTQATSPHWIPGHWHGRRSFSGKYFSTKNVLQLPCGRNSCTDFYWPVFQEVVQIIKNMFVSFQKYLFKCYWVLREDPLVSTFNYLSSNYHLISVNEVTISYTYINVINIISNCLDLFPNYLFSLLCIILISKQFLCKLVSDEIWRVETRSKKPAQNVQKVWCWKRESFRVCE